MKRFGRRRYINSVIISLNFILLLLISNGCSTTNHVDQSNSIPTDSHHQDLSVAEPSDDLASAAASQAEMFVKGLANSKPVKRKQKVIWIEHQNRKAIDPLADSAVGEPASLGHQSQAPTTPSQSEKSVAKTSVEGEAVPQMQRVESSDEQDLLRRLRDQIRGDDQGSPLHLALRESIINVLDGAGVPKDHEIEGLNEQESDMVKMYVKLLTDLEGRMAQGLDKEEWDRTAKMLQALVDQDQALRISKVQLCRSVQGFGVYQELDGTTFLAGRDHPAIIYVELDGFQSVIGDKRAYEVRLDKEVMLHNQADDLVVWQPPKVAITDQSRNQRRDFFMVQLVRLPARLNVGKYQLKVRVTDRANGSVDEAVVPIHIVADRALAANDGP